VVHFEIGCRDREQTAGFYAELFGWAITEAGPASMIDTQAGSVGIQGHISSLGHEPHQYVTIYVQVDDIPAALARAESLGGKTLVPPVKIPTGTFAWFADPGGNPVGLWTPAG
jgi:predicted enzyme related to lactoylglutathione lyase